MMELNWIQVGEMESNLEPLSGICARVSLLRWTYMPSLVQRCLHTLFLSLIACLRS